MARIVKGPRARSRRGGISWAEVGKYSLGAIAASIFGPPIAQQLSRFVNYIAGIVSYGPEESRLRAEYELEEKKADEAQKRAITLAEKSYELSRKEREADLKAAREHLETLKTGLTPSGLSTTPYQARSQAVEFVRVMKIRYPAVFTAHPDYEGIIEGQLLSALLAPPDPTDTMHVQKVMGDLEYNLALIQARLVPQPTAAEKLIARPDYTRLPTLGERLPAPASKAKGSGHRPPRNRGLPDVRRRRT